MCGDYDVWCKAVRYLAIDIKQLIVYSSSAIICFSKHFPVCCTARFFLWISVCSVLQERIVSDFLL